MRCSSFDRALTHACSRLCADRTLRRSRDLDGTSIVRSTLPRNEIVAFEELTSADNWIRSYAAWTWTQTLRSLASPCPTATVGTAPGAA